MDGFAEGSIYGLEVGCRKGWSEGSNIGCFDGRLYG